MGRIQLKCVPLKPVIPGTRAGTRQVPFDTRNEGFRVSQCGLDRIGRHGFLSGLAECPLAW